MPLAKWIPDAVRDLHARGLSQRDISKQLPVGRGSVGAILSGKRRDKRAHPVDPVDPVNSMEPAGPPAKCPECGGLVLLPCRACFVRQLVRLGQLARPFADVNADEDDLKPQLPDAAAGARYQEIKRRKQAAGCHGRRQAIEEREFVQVGTLGGIERDQMGEVLFVEELPDDDEIQPPTADQLREAMSEESAGRRHTRTESPI